MSLASPQPRRPGSPRLCGRPTASQSGRPGPSGARMAPVRRNPAPLPPPQLRKPSEARAPRGAERPAPGSARRALHACAGAQLPLPSILPLPPISRIIPIVPGPQPPHVPDFGREVRAAHRCAGGFAGGSREQGDQRPGTLSTGNSVPAQGGWPKPGSRKLVTHTRHRQADF